MTIYSMLDLSPVNQGSTAGEALHRCQPGGRSVPRLPLFKIQHQEPIL